MDFSFLKLLDVDCKCFQESLPSDVGLKKEEPRAGKRKPIEESDDEEELKKVRRIVLNPSNALLE